MSNESIALFLALGATLSFSSSSILFTLYSSRLSVLWMNLFKVNVALVFLGLTWGVVEVLFRCGWISSPIEFVWPGWPAFSAIILSGFIGLCIGDIFLLSAFTRLGPARTLILFGFQPLLVGTGAYFLFSQPVSTNRFIAVVFLIGCLVTFSLERFRQHRTWEFRGLTFALAGVTLDSMGVLMTRWAYTQSLDLPPIETHIIRSLGALLGFLLLSRFWPIHLIRQFKNLKTRDRVLVIVASFGGTYLSLLLYLSAIKIGHLASITAIGITGPMFAAALECLTKRQRPSLYLMIAFAFFLIGFYFLSGAHSIT